MKSNTALMQLSCLIRLSKAVDAAAIAFLYVVLNDIGFVVNGCQKTGESETLTFLGNA